MAPKVFNCLFWFLIFFIPAWPIGFFCAWLYVIFMVLNVCCDVSDFTDFLLMATKLPFYSLRGMFKCNECSDCND